MSKLFFKVDQELCKAQMDNVLNYFTVNESALCIQFLCQFSSNKKYTLN